IKFTVMIDLASAVDPPDHVNTSFSGGTKCRYVPTTETPLASSKQNTPPSRASSALTVMLMPRGLNQLSNASGSIHGRNTRSRGAQNVRRTTRMPVVEIVEESGSGRIGEFIGVSLLVRGGLQVVFQRVELGLPELSVGLKPGGDFAQGARRKEKAVRSP